MAWGAKLPVISQSGSGSLDIGIALLVKALPLARLAKSFSCDGHGSRSAKIWFHFPWDAAWGTAVFRQLGFSPQISHWQWCRIDDADVLEIEPLQGSYDEIKLMGMLNDIQLIARRLLDKNVIMKIWDARNITILRFGSSAPTVRVRP